MVVLFVGGVVLPSMHCSQRSIWHGPGKTEGESNQGGNEECRSRSHAFEPQPDGEMSRNVPRELLVEPQRYLSAGNQFRPVSSHHGLGRLQILAGDGCKVAPAE